MSIKKEEVDEYIKKNAIPMRTILENAIDERLKGRLVAIRCKGPRH